MPWADGGRDRRPVAVPPRRAREKAAASSAVGVSTELVEFSRKRLEKDDSRSDSGELLYVEMGDDTLNESGESRGSTSFHSA